MSRPIQLCNPIQRFVHLRNRLDSNKTYRDERIIQKVNLERLHKAAMQAIDLDLTAISLEKERLLDEGRALLPDLKPFDRCYRALQSILDITFSR